MADDKTQTQKENYERLLLAIALYYSNAIGIDTTVVDEYSKLTEQQKTFAKKIVEQNPKIERQLERKTRIPEKTIVKDVAKIAQEDEDSGDLKKIITAGDQTVCHQCRKWQNKIVSLSGNSSRYPSLDDAINDHFLHYGCRCALIDLKTDEIPLKEPNPRRPERV